MLQWPCCSSPPLFASFFDMRLDNFSLIFLYMVVFEYCCTWFLLFDTHLSRPYHLCLTKCIPALLCIFQFIKPTLHALKCEYNIQSLACFDASGMPSWGSLEVLKTICQSCLLVIDNLILYILCMMRNSMYETKLTCTEIWTQWIHNLLHVLWLLECPDDGTQEVTKHVWDCVSIVPHNLVHVNLVWYMEFCTFHFLGLLPNLHISHFLSAIHSNIITIHLIPLTKLCTRILLYYKASCMSYFLFQVPILLLCLLCSLGFLPVSPQSSITYIPCLLTLRILMQSQLADNLTFIF